MRMITAAVTGLFLTIGSAASCAAADLPREGGFGPGLEEAPVMEARVVCDAFGRCFRVRPYRGFYGPDGAYGGPRVGVPPRFGGAPPYGDGFRYGDEPRFGNGPRPGYEPRYGERSGQAPGFERRRPDEPRYGERRDGPSGDPYRGADGSRRPDGYGPSQMRPGPDPRTQDYGERN